MFVLELLAAYLNHMCSEFGSKRPNERHIVPRIAASALVPVESNQRARREKRKAGVTKLQMEINVISQADTPALLLWLLRLPCA